jgi:hypothetical protein
MNNRTHGTCSGLEPAQYFDVARELYERVSVPPRFLAPGTELVVSTDEIEREFASANPWLKPEMISVSRRGPDLLDIRVCFGRDLFPRSCGVNEDQTRLCRASKIEGCHRSRLRNNNIETAPRPAACSGHPLLAGRDGVRGDAASSHPSPFCGEGRRGAKRGVAVGCQLDAITP